MKLNLYEAIIKLNCDKDISDTIFDFLNYFTCCEENKAQDDYEKLMIYFAKHIEVVSINDCAIICELSKFINEHIKAFNKFMNEENKPIFQPRNYGKITTDDENFYELYLNTFSSLINGNYCDEDYTKLLKYLTK